MKKNFIVNGVVILTFVGSLFVFTSFAAEECGCIGGTPCSHSAQTEKTIVGICGSNPEMRCWKCICITGSGNACTAGKCECKLGDPHTAMEQD